MKVQGLSFKPKALAVLPEIQYNDLEATFKIYNDDYNIVASMEASYELGVGGSNSGTFCVGSSDRNYETTLFSDGFESLFSGRLLGLTPKIRWFAVGKRRHKTKMAITEQEKDAHHGAKGGP